MRVQGRRVGCRATDTYAGGPRQNSPLPPRDQAASAGHGKCSRRREGETVILVCGLSSDHKVSGLPRPSSCDCGCWATIFDCYGPLISTASNWRMIFLCLYSRELKAWAHSRLALGAVEVRIRALRTRSHPSTPGPEDGPKGPALVPPPGRMSEGPGKGFLCLCPGCFDGEFRMPLVLAQASPIFHSSCEGKLGIALE